MIYNTSEFSYLFQKLICIDPQSQPQQFQLITILAHNNTPNLVQNVVNNFPPEDRSLAEETIGSGNFINCSIYSGNKTIVFSEPKILNV